MKRRWLRLGVVALGGLILAVGCGRKSVPLPPVVRKAEQTRDLAVYQEGEEAVLRFSYPSLTTAGGPLPDLQRVEVWRLALAPAQEPKGTSDRDRKVRVQLLNAQGEKIAVLGEAELDAATRGPTLVFRDDLAAWYAVNKDKMPLVLWYAVRSVCCGDRPSEFSNIARLEPQVPPPPPTNLSGEATLDAIILRWTPVEGTGTLVERAAPDGTWQRVTATPLTDSSWRDTGARQGETWRYRLRAAHSTAAGSLVVGAPSPEVTVPYPDVYPPAAPANVVCLPEGGLVRLRWDAVPGAAGYRVYRQRAGGGWVHLAEEERGLELTDRDAPAGTVTYAVKAVDAAGNESDAASCTAVVAPAP